MLKERTDVASVSQYLTCSHFQEFKP